MAEIIGTPRDDHLTGTSVTDSPTGADDIFGVAGDDRIDGRSGDDRLFGGPGADQLVGSLGDDLLFGDDDDDVLSGGLGDDQLFGGNGRDLLLGDDGDDLLAGDADDDDLLGGIGDDRLEGGDGNDNLFGDAGDDHLNGGPGLDRHQGGPGADRFGLSDLDAADEILDFDPGEGDGLDVARLVQDALDAGASFAEVVRVEVTSAGTLVALDPDGSGFRDAALLRGVALTAAQLGLDLPSPVAVDDSASTNQSTAILLDPLANDQGGGDELTLAALDTTGTVGTVTLEADGRTLTYTPDPTFFGIDTFRYTVANSLGETDDAEIRVGVLGTENLSEISQNDDPRGFALNGVAPFDYSGRSLSSAGDINGDGLADVIVGAPNAAPSGENSGQSYVVFGKADGAVVELRDIVAGAGGFALNGINAFDLAGTVSGAADVNGDGLADIIVGAGGADPNGSSSGQSYVIFGRAGGTTVDLADVEQGLGGYALNGIAANDFAGGSVSGGGDVNGDGLADVLVGAYTANPNGRFSGQSYVVFGKADGATVELREIVAGIGGFALNGIATDDVAGSVSYAGDVDGDGLADIVVGAQRADPNGDRSGQSYVVFGRADGATVELSDVVAGIGGFAINGINPVDLIGREISGAGDVNGDGLSDIVLGSESADPNGDRSGQSYVVFGKADGATVELSEVLAGIGGFAINGIAADDNSGHSVADAGDVDGDGLADILIGSTNPGQTYLVFGKADGSVVELGDVVQGIGGFALNGVEINSLGGDATAGAGDVDGDGFADIITSDPTIATQGQSYLVFGGDFTASADLLGTTDADQLVGTAADEIIVGAQGNDTLIGGGGADLLNGAAGDDLLAIGDVGFRKLLGGSGTDTVRLDGAGDTLDLTAISDLFVRDIERIDLNGDGNELVLNTLEILNIDDNSNTLTVFGDGTNAVCGDLAGAAVGHTTVGGVAFASFTVGNAELLVQNAVDTSGIVV